MEHTANICADWAVKEMSGVYEMRELEKARGEGKIEIGLGKRR